MEHQAVKAKVRAIETAAAMEPWIVRQTGWRTIR